MKIALVGYGQVGRAIDQIAAQEGMTVVGRVWPHAPEENDRKISESSLGEAEVAIDFTRPDAVVKNIEELAALRRDIVVGTTGWFDQLDRVSQIVENYGIGLLYAPNFSIGMLLFQDLAKQAARKLGSRSEACFALTDRHHTGKLDSPSGTAKALAKEMAPHLVNDLEMTSQRVGKDPGHHNLVIDLPFETVTLTHGVRSRETYAQGALHAARWLTGKRGIFSITDMLEGINSD